MAVRFDLNDANLLAHLITDLPPVLRSSIHSREFLGSSLLNLSHGFISAPDLEIEFRNKIEVALNDLRNFSEHSTGETVDFILNDLKAYLATRVWTALIVPSGEDREVDRLLCSENFVREMVELRPDAPGLILQLEEAPSRIFSMLNVFPAFNTALARTTEWPGILIWERSGVSAFFPLDGRSARHASQSARWIFSHLATSFQVDLKLLVAQYYREHPQLKSRPNSNVTFIHLSDIHLGSQEAYNRVPRLQQLIRNVVNESDDHPNILFLLTGDLLNTPSQANSDNLRSFLDVLLHISNHEPLIVLGNHDVRKDGFLHEQLRYALGISGAPHRVVWLEEYKIGFACFNSVVEGHLARGSIGDRQFSDLGSALDRKSNWRDYALFALLHHHPIPVDIPSWYAKPFYERVLGSWFEKTDELEDAESFLRFVETRGFQAIFHGHKHIPRIGFTPVLKVPIFGCGSSVGKVITDKKDTFISINTYRYNVEKRILSGRLLAERLAGEGLSELTRHEVICRKT